jgi:glycosyltransferase involved in cell wall biosynthesis
MSFHSEKPLVSIIIPCYNGADYLEQALKSVQWQTWQHWECIVVDDGSIDRSAEVFYNFTKGDNRFRYFYQTNNGLAAARNSGLDLSKGDYIQFLDDDDILLPQRLENCIQTFLSHPESDIVYTEYVCFQKGRGFTQDLPAKLPEADTVRAFLFQFDRKFIIPVHSFLFRSRIIKKNKFNPKIGSHGEDIDCWIRIAIDGARFYYLDEILAIYRYSLGTLAQNEVAIFSSKLRILESYQTHPQLYKYDRDYRCIIQHYRERLAIAFLVKKDFAYGLKEMKIIWNSASIISKIKLIGWLVLMLLFTKGTVFRFRAWIMLKTRKKNDKICQWTPPISVEKLIESKTE